MQISSSCCNEDDDDKTTSGEAGEISKPLYSVSSRHILWIQNILRLVARLSLGIGINFCVCVNVVVRRRRQQNQTGVVGVTNCEIVGSPHRSERRSRRFLGLGTSNPHRPFSYRFTSVTMLVNHTQPNRTTHNRSLHIIIQHWLKRLAW